MGFYDPDIAPDSAAWLAIPENERMRVIKNYHVANRIKLPNVKGHAAMHAVVENQLAIGFGPGRRAMARLQAEGLSRHEALHAIGSVVAELYFETTKNPQAGEAEKFQMRMNAEIDQLSSADWKSRYGR